MRHALAVVAAAKHCGLSNKQIQSAFDTFKGIKRRMEVRGISGGVTVIDDFGHHPTAIRETLRVVNRFFQLRTCTDHVLETRKRPCILHQIGRCPAPCVFEIPAELYHRGVEDAVAFLEGREYVLPEDVKRVAPSVLRHRLLLSYEAEAEGCTPDAIVREVLASVPTP